MQNQSIYTHAMTEGLFISLFVPFKPYHGEPENEQGWLQYRECTPFRKNHHIDVNNLYEHYMRFRP